MHTLSESFVQTLRSASRRRNRMVLRLTGSIRSTAQRMCRRRRRRSDTFRRRVPPRPSCRVPRSLPPKRHTLHTERPPCKPHSCNTCRDLCCLGTRICRSWCGLRLGCRRGHTQPARSRRIRGPRTSRPHRFGTSAIVPIAQGSRMSSRRARMCCRRSCRLGVPLAQGCGCCTICNVKHCVPRSCDQRSKAANFARHPH